MVRAGDDKRGPTESAYRTPLTPVTGEADAAALVPQPAQRDTPETTPMASAPTPLEDDVPPLPPPPPEPETTPSHIGRFVVLKRLGSGGMGVVYAAYDQELDRKVALKVLRTRVSMSKRETAKQRLQREAQAMARLSHPNVVGIYDVGTVEDQVFLAMEFVHGTTLTRWLQAERRTWHQVLEVYMQAGRGLCAAHKAGIIHRDFKPDNVLIDREGRVRVVDFGLARADVGSGGFPRPDTYANAIKPMASSSMLNMRITRTGGMTGTPAYMAPEQYKGEPTDARTDQFSFCVALYEGLYGVRPFLGERVAVVREAVLGGHIQDVPKDSTVPPWLRRILCRGLQVRPEERFRSMDDLLARLADDPRKPTRRWLAIAGAAIVVGAGALVVHDLTRTSPAATPMHALCDTDAALAGVWDPTVRTQVGAALGSALPPTDARALRVTAVLDDYAAAWQGAVAAVCVPADAGPRGSFDQRAACMQRRLAGLRGLTAALMTADAVAASHALAAAWGLPPVRSCEDGAGPIGALARPGTDEALTRLDAAALAAALGELGLGLARTKAVVDEAVKTDDLPLQAEGLYRQASLEHEAGDDAAAERSLHGALWAAEASQRGDLEIDSLTLLLEVMGGLGKDKEAVALWPRLTKSLLERRDDGPREAAALHAFGRLLLRRGQHPEAVTQLELALRLCERNLGASHPRVGEVMVDLAVARTRTGATSEALRLLDGAVELLSRALTDRDPALGRAYLARADARRLRAQPREAAQDYARAGELGAGEPATAAAVRLGQAQVAADEGRWGDAADGYAEALTLAEQARGPTDASLVAPLLGQCRAASTVGRHEFAVAACRRALEVADRTHGAAGAGPARVSLARALWAQAEAGETLSPEVRAQILELARTGLEELQRAPHPDPAEISANATWIAEHSRG